MCRFVLAYCTHDAHPLHTRIYSTSFYKRLRNIRRRFFNNQGSRMHYHAIGPQKKAALWPPSVYTGYSDDVHRPYKITTCLKFRRRSSPSAALKNYIGPILLLIFLHFPLPAFCRPRTLRLRYKRPVRLRPVPR